MRGGDGTFAGRDRGWNGVIAFDAKAVSRFVCHRSPKCRRENGRQLERLSATFECGRSRARPGTNHHHGLVSGQTRGTIQMATKNNKTTNGAPTFKKSEKR
jgi:hypothetical protein